MIERPKLDRAPKQIEGPKIESAPKQIERSKYKHCPKLESIPKHDRKTVDHRSGSILQTVPDTDSVVLLLYARVVLVVEERWTVFCVQTVKEMHFYYPKQLRDTK